MSSIPPMPTAPISIPTTTATNVNSTLIQVLQADGAYRLRHTPHVDP
jgi:hypothetical protein